jgi:hypothetical protein
MIDLAVMDYAAFDRPEILQVVFHPRKEWGAAPAGSALQDLTIVVDEGIVVGARFHTASKTAATILFFHGNGEIAADYDDLGPIYTRMGINFLAADYRGYGRSTGTPTITAMMRDCHAIYAFVRDLLCKSDFTGPFIVMGRSLGSASALELAAAYPDDIDGLILESAFAHLGPLLRRLGVNLEAFGFSEERGLGHLAKIGRFSRPTLIIHAERDHIIPWAEAQALHNASPAATRTLVAIRNAGHNDIFHQGLTTYMSAVKQFADGLQRPAP